MALSMVADETCVAIYEKPATKLAQF